MRRFLPLTAALFAAAALTAGAQAPLKDKPGKDDKAPAKADKGTAAPLAEGKNLPGPFHPFNVTGPFPDRFHCPVSDHNLDPVVLIFTRDLEFSDPLRKLLAGLDSAIDKNPATRLAAAVTFLSDDLPNVVEDDDKRDELKAKLQDLAKTLMLKHVVLCLDSKSDLEKYALDDSVVATVVLYRKLQVVAVHVLPRDQFTAARVQKLLDDVASKLGAKRK